MKTTAGANTPPPTSPVCGAPMQPYGRGAARSQYKARWICPVARQEEFTDEKGRVKRSPDAQHKEARVWSDDELEAEAPHCLPPTIDQEARLARLQEIVARLDTAVEAAYLAADLLIPLSPDRASTVRNAARRLDSERKQMRAAAAPLDHNRPVQHKDQTP